MNTPLENEIAKRFGVLPNFFRLASGEPQIVANLWGFAQFAYLDGRYSHRRHPEHTGRAPHRRRHLVLHCRRSHLWRRDMKASLFYRIAAVLLLLFAVGHTLGFRQSDPAWGVDTLLGSMRSIHFDVQGFSRTYWDLFLAAGYSVGVFYLFAAVLAWQLASLPAETLAPMRIAAWALALCFAAITVVSWRYLFILPIVFSIVITACLTAAVWLSTKPSPRPPRTEPERR
jgi:hypothetical protein